MSVEITVKCSNADKATFTVERSITVGEFKEIIGRQMGIAPNLQRLIFKGRVLKDDSTLEHYDVTDGQTVHLVKSSTGTSSPAPASTQPASSAPSSGFSDPFRAATSAPRGGAGAGASPMDLSSMMGQFGGMGMDPEALQAQMMRNPEMMQQMMSSPMMQSMLSNPDLIRDLMMNNPQLQAMLDANPHIRHVFNDPQLMRQTMEMMRNPQAMQEAMRHQDLAMSHLENHPEGFNALRRMYEDIQEPMLEASQNPFGASGTSAASPQATTPAPGAAPNSAALPNPWGGTSAPPRPSNPFGASPSPFGASAMGGNPFGAAGGMGGNPFGAMGMDPTQMLQNPMFQSMMREMTANPQMMEQAIQSDPMLRQMVDANPQMRAMLSNPAMMRQVMDPNNLAAIMQLQRSGMIPSAPGFPGFQAPMTPAAPPVSSTVAGLDFSAILGTQAPASVPWPAFPAGSVPAAAPLPAVRFATQLRQLTDMGFSDEAANIRALTATSGNVNAAIERLLNGL